MAFNFPPSSTAEIIRPTQFCAAQPPECTPSVGHNRPTFDNIVEENLRRGIYLSQLNCITRAVRDPRITSRHLQVLAQIIERTNTKTGFAYPGRARLAADIAYFTNGEAKSYSLASIATTISDLIEYGYIVAEKRGVEGKGRALSHYATTAPSVEELQAQITAWCEKIRSQPPRKFPAQQSADVDISINIRNGAEVDTRVSVTNSDGDTRVNVDNGITVSSEADGDAGIEADGDNGILTVTGDDLTGSKKDRPPFDLDPPDEGDQSSKAKTANKKGSRLPDNWELPQEWRLRTQAAHGLTDVQINSQAERFRRHWLAKPGKEARKLRWDLTWDNWVDRAIEHGLKPAWVAPASAETPEERKTRIAMGPEKYALYRAELAKKGMRHA